MYPWMYAEIAFDWGSLEHAQSLVTGAAHRPLGRQWKKPTRQSAVDALLEHALLPAFLAASPAQVFAWKVGELWNLRLS